jgi:isopentenyldiphosphate isomerase
VRVCGETALRPEKEARPTKMLASMSSWSRRRLASRAVLFAAASSSPSPPLGQDLSELFALYKPPAVVDAPLQKEKSPELLGMLKPRGEVHRDGDWHRSIHCWLLDDEGRLVLQRRSEHKDTHPNLLDVSCAGHITGNDPVLETAVRELEEELGILLPAEELEASWLCTLPSSMSGETKHGKFVCNEYQEIFLVEGFDSSGVDSLALGTDEVAGVELVDAGQVIAAWEDGDAAYVPRGAAYRRVLGAALGFFPSGGW